MVFPCLLPSGSLRSWHSRIRHWMMASQVTDVNGCHLSEKTLAALEAAMKEDWSRLRKRWFVLVEKKAEFHGIGL